MKTAPDGCNFVQQHVVEIADLSQKIADEITDGVSHNNPNKMNATARKMEKAHDVSRELTDALGTLRGRDDR